MVNSAVFLKAVKGSRPELIKIPARLRHPNDRHVQVSALHHALQRRKNLFVGQIARCSEEDQGVRMQIAHLHLPSTYDLFGCFLHVSTKLVPHGGQEGYDAIVVHFLSFHAALLSARALSKMYTNSL